jgi:hypothetical protein
MRWQGRCRKDLLVSLLHQSRGPAKNQKRRMGYVREAMNTLSCEMRQLGTNLLALATSSKALVECKCQCFPSCISEIDQLIRENEIRCSAPLRDLKANACIGV